MKTIYLIRHAKAEEADSTTNDIERTLTTRGKDDSKIMAQTLKDKIKMPIAILCSDADRALQTARVFAKVLNVERDSIVQNKAIYTSHTAIELLQVVTRLDDNNNCILMVGHNPSITELLNSLCNENFASIPTCAVAKIELDVDSWEGVSFGTGKSIFLDTPRKYK